MTIAWTNNPKSRKPARWLQVAHGVAGFLLVCAAVWAVLVAVLL